jgi:hypothetical protein
MVILLPIVQELLNPLPFNIVKFKPALTNGNIPPIGPTVMIIYFNTKSLNVIEVME